MTYDQQFFWCLLIGTACVVVPVALIMAVVFAVFGLFDEDEK